METSTSLMTDAVIPRPAATVLLLRDGAEGIEVFMATRHQRSSFMPGILVFPGGAVDPDDSHPALLGEGSPDDASRVAGIREVFEEAGFLLARPKGGTRLVDASQVEPFLATARQSLCKGEAIFSTVMHEAGLVPATDCLIPFAHWVTPKYRSKRFDVRFYVTRAPEGQAGVHDDQEMIDSRWITPARAFDETAAGKIRIVFATRSQLALLAKNGTVDEESPDGPALRIPAEAGYDVTEVLMRNIGE